MGNRSSSHYPPPPHWMHQRTSYSTSASPYPEVKRPIAPGAFAEPYIVPNTNPMRRSMISLNADSGYVASPADTDRMRMRGSRMSLNQMDFDPMPHHVMPPPPRLIIPPDAKTLKKLEKMEKKHQKLMKKLGARGIPMPPPPPLSQMHPMYSRALSFDDLNSRIHEAEIDAVRLRPRDWRAHGEARAAPSRRETTHSQYIKQNFSSNSTRRAEISGSLASSSPMTSSEESGHSSDPWNNSSVSSSRNQNQREMMSPPMYTSTPHQHMSPRPTSQVVPISKTIEVKVERSEKIEHTTQKPSNDGRNSSGPTYAQPIIRGQPSYGSRTSSVATSQMRGDQSEIDFSWVNEEEDKLKKEHKGDGGPQRLPEFYFGMDPPTVEEKENDEEKRRRQQSVLAKTAAFEAEARQRKEPAFISRSTHHLTELPNPDYSPLQVHTREIGGPAERRIYRIQRQSDNQRNDDRRYRSSIAF
ncbi:unnamed protein product [Caenorhabditis bovis]|uniref:Uncharacterized protein n=1 Tax=Caenorhabditis bovis TaxID=2654633 RepID=A0A8S1F816_9PELO|nr:unnamed protein product [Caenorhabditis bovis]